MAVAATTVALGLLLVLAVAHARDHSESGRKLLNSRHRHVKILPMLKSRHDLGGLLEAEGFRTGAELGVQQGIFSESILSNWPSVEKFYLIDAWEHQENYMDGANHAQTVQNQFYQETKDRLERWKEKTVFLRMFTVDAVKEIPGQLDFIYVDARHDYCAVSEDLHLYWPLLKPGGIMAGHDYEDAADVRAVLPGEDWAVCSNGSRHEGAVKGAVHEFFSHLGLQYAVTYREGNFNTWFVRKPHYF